MNIVVAITGASGTVIGMKLIEEIRKRNYDITVLISVAGKKVMEKETDCNIEPDYKEDDIAAPIASSSNKVDAFIICPCSMKTLSAVANGYSNTLINRLADVQLKMRRKLILCVRETPFNLIHIENMRKVILAGGDIMPLNAAYYFKPKTLEDMNNFFVGKILDLLNVESSLYKRWNG